MNYDFQKITGEFKISGKLISCKPCGDGHINDTFMAKFDEDGVTKKYIVGRMNKSLFTDPPKLMSNIRLVTEFMRKKIAAAGGDPDRECVSIVYTKDGESYKYFEEYGEYFRVYRYIEGVAHSKVERPGQFGQSAVAFGRFAKLLSDFDATKLYDILPDFHNTKKRFSDFENSVRENKSGRAALVRDEIAFVEARENYCSRIVDLLESGEMPLRVTHNDTKLNNVLLDEETDKPVAVIDLDTVMAGSICYDFGDSIRFGCNTAAEDEPNLDIVHFDIGLFEEYAKCYLSEVGESITKVERDNLAFGAILMTFECGMRFLADYIDGDTYFKTSREGQNLDRARTQFRLVSEMEKLLPEMEKIVNKY